MNPSEPSEGLFFSAFSRTSPSLRKGFRIALPARRRLSNSVDYEYTFAYYPMNDVEVKAGEMFYIEAEADSQIIIPSAL